MAKNGKSSFENATLYYLGRFSVSKKQLYDFLIRRKRRLERKGMPPEFDTEEVFKEIIDKMERLGYINDERLAERTIELMREQGRSARYIQAKLKQKGLKAEVPMSLEEEKKAAKKFFEKKKIAGLPKEKALARMARAGFSYEIIKELISF